MVRVYPVYSLRHTCAMRLLSGFYKRKDGTRIKLGEGEVAAILGNSVAMVEKVYGHRSQTL